MEFSLQQLADVSLPNNFHGRWITKRKAAVIAQIVTGRLTIEEACQRYNISLDELSSWQRAFDPLWPKRAASHQGAKKEAVRGVTAEKIP
jgi:transposase-like protein